MGDTPGHKSKESRELNSLVRNGLPFACAVGCEALPFTFTFFLRDLACPFDLFIDKLLGFVKDDRFVYSLELSVLKDNFAIDDYGIDVFGFTAVYDL